MKKKIIAIIAGIAILIAGSIGIYVYNDASDAYLYEQDLYGCPTSKRAGRKWKNRR